MTTVLEKFIEKHPDWKWDMYFLSSNPSITPEFIEKHSDWKWRY